MLLSDVRRFAFQRPAPRFLKIDRAQPTDSHATLQNPDSTVSRRCHLVSDHRESSTDSGSSAPPHTQRFLQENVFLAIVGGWRRWVCVMRVGQTTDSGRGVFFRVASDRRNGDTVVRWMLGALGLLAHNVPI